MYLFLKETYCLSDRKQNKTKHVSKQTNLCKIRVGWSIPTHDKDNKAKHVKCHRKHWHHEEY